MAKQDLSRYQEKVIKRYYDNQDTILSTKLSELVSDLWLAEDEKTQERLWKRVEAAIVKLPLDAEKVQAILTRRDLEGLARLANEASAAKPQAAKPGDQPAASKAVADPAQPESKPKSIREAQAEIATQGGYDALDEHNLKRAMKAFRRKLKSMKLDDESLLGSRYTTGGRKSDISAIAPPREFPTPVWRKLVELGRLKSAGQGLYQLP